MPNLKDLKTRIKSVKNTQKITKAMKMVAASKLKKAQERAEHARPYAEKMEQMLMSLASKANPDNAPLLLSGRRDAQGRAVDKIHLLIVATADKGLCGGFNSSIVKEVRQQIARREASGQQVKILTVGKKGYEQLAGQFKNRMVSRIHTHTYRQPEYSIAEDAAHQAIALFERGEIDSCSVVYNKFLNALTQKVTVQPLIPLEIGANDNAAQADGAVYEYEPSEEEILVRLLPLNIATQVFRALLENAASEQGARMTAMDNATRNAGEMINKLTLQYNRTRQAAITKELIEIISGAEAL